MKRVGKIAFSGLDGVGKTLYSRIIAYILASKGLKVKIIWVKSLHTLAYVLYMFFRRIGVNEWIINPNGVVVEHYSSPVIRRLNRLWSLIEFLSIIPWLIVIGIYKLLGYTVILDRYLYDFLIVVGIRIGNPLWFTQSIIGKTMYLHAKKTKTVVLDAPLKIIMKRRVDIEYTLEELLIQRALYRLLARINEDLLLETSCSKSVVLKKLWSAVVHAY